MDAQSGGGEGRKEEWRREGQKEGDRQTYGLKALGSRTLPEKASSGKFYLVGLQQAGTSPVEPCCD